MSVVVSAVVVAADAWGTAAFVGAALTAVADVGVATSVIGAVTGNTTMEKVGGALGLVGGVGGLINSGLSSAAVGASDAAGSLGTTGTDAAATGATDSVVLPGANAGSAADASMGLGSTSSGADGIASANAGAGLGQTGATAAAPGSAQVGADLSVTNPSGAVAGAPGTASSTPFAQSASQAPGSYPGSTDNGLFSTPTPTVPAAASDPSWQAITGGQVTPAGATDDWVSQIKSSVGSAWNSMQPTAQAELLKSVLAIPGGIQAQKNAAAQLAIAQQKTAQTSFGNSLPTFNSTANSKGILSNAMGK